MVYLLRWIKKWQRSVLRLHGSRARLAHPYNYFELFFQKIKKPGT
jgi:hypothetical protein